MKRSTASMFFCVTILLGGCKSLPELGMTDKSDSAKDEKSEKIKFLGFKEKGYEALRLAQQQREKGDISTSLDTYQKVATNSASDNIKAAAIMGQFTIRIQNWGKSSNLGKAEKLSEQLQQLAAGSSDPVVHEIAQTTASYLANQNFLHKSMQKMSESLKTKDEEIAEQADMLAQQTQELENKEKALRQLKKVMIGN